MGMSNRTQALSAARYAIEQARECRLAGLVYDARLWALCAANTRRSFPFRISAFANGSHISRHSTSKGRE